MRLRVLAPAVAVVGFVGCAGTRDAPRPPARTTLTPAAVVASATSSSTSSAVVASTSASASGSAAPRALCFDGPPTGPVGYDAASDTITVCPGGALTKGSCASLSAGGAAVDADPPGVPLKERAMPVFSVPREPALLVRAGARLVVQGDAKRWVAMPAVAAPAYEGVQALWTSANGARALVWRSIGAEGATIQREMLDVVDLVAHVVVAHTEGCAYFAGADSARADAGENLLLMTFSMANPVLTRAAFDVKQGRFLILDPKGAKAAPGKSCSSYAIAPSFVVDHEFGVLSDATHRRTDTELLTLEGKSVAALTGDFPRRGPPHLVLAERELTIDEATRVLVLTTASQVCTGVMHLAPGVAPSSEGPQSKTRCAPSCVKPSEDAWH